MKTAISVPDATFEAASRRARELGMSRSEFFSRAAVAYLDQLDGDSLTARIDSSLSDGVDDGSVDAVAAAHRFLAANDDSW